MPLAAAFLAVLVALVVPPWYTATTTFVPESPAGSPAPAGLAGLASQFGLTLGTAASQSPRFYADVLKSRELMERVLLARYPEPRSPYRAGDSASLVEILEPGGEDAADSLYRALKRLSELVTTDADNRTNMVRLDVDARDPALAALVANRFVEYLHEFNARTRQSRARERRKFAENRLSQAQRDLRAAEQELRAFYERNRSWQQAPQLLFEEGRLRREVDVRQEVHLTLSREYETARIDEVNDIPVITVVDRAVPPEEKSKPKRHMVVIVALMVGGIVGVLLAVAVEHVDRLRREDDGEYREFRRLLRRLRADSRRVVSRGHSGPEVGDESGPAPAA
jgi:uncharacterized protein involved in exopolysaccharide biosynthesis